MSSAFREPRSSRQFSKKDGLTNGLLVYNRAHTQGRVFELVFLLAILFSPNNYYNN